MVKIAEQAVEKSLSVRQTEEAVAAWGQPSVKKTFDEANRLLAIDPNVREAEKELERALGVRVFIKDKKGRGKIQLEYNSLEDFDRIVTLVAGK